jgi:hypothetical protein
MNFRYEGGMTRLLEARSQASAAAARHEWVVSAGGPLDPAELVERLGAVASALVRGFAGVAVRSTGIEHLTILSSVGPGERLAATLAIEQPLRGAGRWPVSIVVRRVVAASPLAVVGVLVFVRDDAAREGVQGARGEGARGQAVVTASFHASQGHDWLLDGNLLPWVQASALLSAQGFHGAPLRARGFEAVSVRGQISGGERLALVCSVVREAGGVLSVLCEVRSEALGHDVLWAVSCFENKT